MSKDIFDLSDNLGPRSVHHFCKPSVGLKAILVIDNVAAGPAIGGIRMGAAVSLEECARLARAMTFKNAAAGLPHGGAKAVIIADPDMDAVSKEEVVRALAGAIGSFSDYIPGPDMGTNERAMAWIKDEIGRSVGLPSVLGGIPLDEIGATGFGLAACADVAKDRIGLDLRGARVAIQGFGAVGKNAARFLGQKGAILVAASDSRGTVHDKSGLDITELIRIKDEGGHLTDIKAAKKLDLDAIVGIECDIWIPAAQPDVIRDDNVGTVRTKLIVQGANIGVTPAAESALHKRGVLCIPDFISNAGGVICAAVEYHGGSQAQAFATIEEKIKANTTAVLDRAKRDGVLPRAAAIAMAESRVRQAMSLRRWHR